MASKKPEPKAPKSTSKTDAMRAQREKQHVEAEARAAEVARTKKRRGRG